MVWPVFHQCFIQIWLFWAERAAVYVKLAVRTAATNASIRMDAFVAAVKCCIKMFSPIAVKRQVLPQVLPDISSDKWYHISSSSSSSRTHI